jgi:uncharacterized membrane protein
MSTNPLVRGRTVFLAVSILAGALAGCRGETPSAPESDLALEASAAKGGKPITGTSGITVSAVDPDTVSTDTIITVRVLGSGFTAGSGVSWALGGVATDAVTTLPPVQFLSSRELQARIVVARDAPLARYDAVVTAVGGKKGIGVEKLEVVAKPIALPVPAWVRRSQATDINAQGVIVGWGVDADGVYHPLRWTPQGVSWSVEELSTAGTALGVNTSALAINDDGYILLKMFETDQWCSVLTPGGPEVAAARSVNDINDNGTIIGHDPATGRSAAWLRATATTWTGPILLPQLQGYSRDDPNDINDRDEIAGSIYDSDGMEWAAVWRFEAGKWTTPVLVDAQMGGSALAINNGGSVAGQTWPCYDTTCTSLPVFWPSIGGARELLPVENTRMVTGMVEDMSNGNLIVGSAPVIIGKRGGTVMHAVVWRPGSSAARDLGALTRPAFSAATAINDGWPAVAVGYTDSGSGERATAWIVF